jgi:acetyltransferase-like isoleucine patch superfamily enzyme
MFFYWKPLFTQYLDSPPKHLNLTVSMPYVIGNPSIKVGDYCTINGRMVIIARTNQSTRPRLSIGNHVFIGFNSAFFIGNDIEIGDHCLISEGCILRGYSGHPLDPEARKAGLPDEESKIGRIVLENNVWLCQDVKINPGVRIGENSVIATGSIVTKDIPANVLAGGIPAEVIKKL